MKELINSIGLLVNNVNKLHDEIIVQAVKNKGLNSSLTKIDNIKNNLSNLLININELEKLNADMYICFENNIYLSIIKKRYVISRIIDKEVEILGSSSSLRRALELFYCNAYNTKRSKLKKILKLFKLS